MSNDAFHEEAQQLALVLGSEVNADIKEVSEDGEVGYLTIDGHFRVRCECGATVEVPGDFKHHECDGCGRKWGVLA